jgi:aspartate/methionine/tyrosine aminotransferase
MIKADNAENTANAGLSDEAPGVSDDRAKSEKIPTAHRLARFTESVIREMTRVANRYGAINLSQGFPDFDPPQELVEAAEKALHGEYHQYAITWGQPGSQRTFRGDLWRNRGHARRLDDRL